MSTPTLGDLRATYSLPRDEMYQSILIYLVVGGLAVWFVMAAVVVFALAGQSEEVLAVAAILAALLVVPTLRFLGYGRRLFSWRTVAIYEGGFILTERGHPIRATWDDIETYTVRAVRLGVDYLREVDAAQMSARLAITLTLQLRDGQRVEIETTVRQMRDVIEGIGRRFALHHLAAAQARIHERGQYYVGNLIVEADRLTYQDIGYRWYQLEKVVFDYVDDLIVVQGGAPRPRPVLPMAKIPNPHLLMLLMAPHTTVLDFTERRVILDEWRTSVLKSRD